MVQLVVIVKILYLNSRDNVVRIETIEMRWASKQWNTF